MTPEELKAQVGEELPDREEMSLVNANVAAPMNLAAAEYRGGEVRGMGAAFYLVYPAFYTDVTDNYRAIA